MLDPIDHGCGGNPLDSLMQRLQNGCGCPPPPCPPPCPCPCPTGPTGPAGPTGPTGPAGPAGATPEDVFAAFATFAVGFTDGSQIPMGTVTADPTRQIVLTGTDRITLAPGYYLLSYHVSVILRDAGYMQITPFYNGQSHIEYGIYFKTGSPTSSAYGSNAVIIHVPEQTRFSLTYNSNVTGTDGTATVAVVKLNRAV